MIRAICSTTLLVFSAGAAWSETLAFEVASVKPSAPMDGRIRIGSTSDGARFSCTNLSLKDLVAQAWRLKPYQVSGPSWMDSERYDITAKIPEGVSKDKVPEMLQSLLAERFKMTVRKDNKEMSIYALVVGKNGAKLKASDDSAASGSLVGPDGGKVNAPKGTMMMDGTGALKANRVDMGAFADMLSRLMDRPVIDMTGIQGKYDLMLEISMEDLVGMKKMAAGMGVGGHMPAGEGGPAPESSPRASVFSAVQQLGLKLDSRKAPVDFLIVEGAEKVATEN